MTERNAQEKKEGVDRYAHAVWPSYIETLPSPPIPSLPPLSPFNLQAENGRAFYCLAP